MNRKGSCQLLQRELLTIDMANQVRRETLPVLMEKKCTRCLPDHRGLTSEPLGVYNIYQLPEQYEQQKISHAIHRALVAQEKQKENFLFLRKCLP